MIIVNNTVLRVWKFLREIFKVLIARKNLWLCMVTDVNKTHCGNHLTIYTNTESLHCIPATSIILCQL